MFFRKVVFQRGLKKAEILLFKEYIGKYEKKDTNEENTIQTSISEVKGSESNGFIETVGIQVFAASMFSFFLGKSLEWLSEHWTSKMYEYQLWPLYFDNIIKVLTIFIPVTIIILTDISGFIFVMYKYWTNVLTPIKNVRDAFLQIFIILPISSWPWAIFHLFTPFLGDNKLFMHFSFFIVWVILSLIAWFLYIKCVKK